MKTLKYAFKKEWYNLILLLLPFLIVPFIWDKLPAQIPTHWNMQGHVDSYSSKSFGLLFAPLLNIGLYFLILYLPKIDPKKRFEINQKPLPILRSLMILFLLGIQFWIVQSAMGQQTIGSQKWLYLGISIFFLVMGNYLKTLKPNYFIGIRVPWTLENEENWRQTHRMGSYLWVAGGLLLIILFPFLSLKTYSTFFFTVIMIIAIVPMAYSFYLYKQSAKN